MASKPIDEIAMFSGLSNVEKAKILGKLERKTILTDELLFRFGDMGRTAYIVLEGQIALYTENEEGERYALAVLGEGELLGEMALLTGEPRSATAIAASDTHMYVITEENLRDFIEQYPKISSYFISLLSNRLTHTNSKLAEIREAEVMRIRSLAEQLPEQLRDACISAALLPYGDILLLQQHFQIDNMREWIDQQNGLNELLQFDSTNQQHFTFSPFAKEVLSELYIEKHGHGARARRLLHAVEYYLSIDDLVAAAMICRGIDNAGWDCLLEYLQRITNRIDLPLVEALQGCPPERLASYPTVMLDYLHMCLESRNEAGYICLKACLELPQHSFTVDELSTLYIWAADWCSQSGMQQKALEYAALAQQLSDPVATAANRFPLIRPKWKSTKQQQLERQAGLLPGRQKLQAIIAMLLAVISLVYFHIAEPIGSFTEQGMDFIGISIAAVMMWIVRVIPDYIVALLMVMLWVMLGVVEPVVALSGFASTSWLYMLFILALGTAIVKSGLLYRFSLLALKLFPASYRGQFLGIVASGALLNPLIPSSSGKVGLGVPLARTLSEAMGYKDRSNGMAGLSLTAMVFYGFTAPFVLTGSYTNMLALGLTGGSVNWFQWFIYALPAFLLFSAVMIAALAWLFRKQEDRRSISIEVLDDQLKLLGSFSRGEKATVYSTLGAILLIMLEPLLGIDYVWIMLIAFVVLVVYGVLDEQTLKTSIDWPFLLFIGVAFSFGEAAIRTGTVDAISNMLGSHMSVFIDSPVWFILAVVLLSFVITLIVRDDAAVILLIVSLAPFAALASIHPWVLVFVVLLATDPFFFTYQSPTYLTAYYSTEGKSFSHKQGQLVAMAYGLAVLLLAVLCVPYWQWLGLIQ
ncbi:SLC13 family permease [Paenibacillus septentrionalis]|uniref:Sodium-dependent dicarboxylate transporter SdcS n=1 Tax=Paenibacillus septentrionalis TaxID=429342 RepID=A0ABW1V9C9_9BACL